MPLQSTRGAASAIGFGFGAGGSPFIVATGGTVVDCGNFRTHIFTGPGSFAVSKAPGTGTVEYLVVAGGGGGGADFGGGAGAGGFRTYTALPGASPLNAPAALPVSAQSYPITVGAQGAGATEFPLTNSVSGNPSIFSTITSTGGGRGGSVPSGPSGVGGSGGSGGGNRFGVQNAGGTGNTPPTSPPQGNPGGPTAAAGNPPYYIGGGGGAGAAGQGKDITGEPNPGAFGGDGSFIPTGFIGPTSPSYGEPGPGGRYFAGGGGTGGYGNAPGGIGGLGGGGGCSPSVSPGTSGVTNTGGGGQGAPNCNPGPGVSRNGGSGGSGIVMIRYQYK